ncbi:MAG: Uma2 family endonuclease [Nocardioides sp.]
MPPDVLGLPQSRPLTYADLDALRDAVDDGHRYELVDGVLVVSPSPRHVHQRGVGNLYLVVRAACPDDLEVLLAPFDVRLADDTVLQPDLLVARRRDVTERNLPTTPVLAIEVLSPSTRSFDLHLKKDRLRRAGCAHYWVVDPGVPSVVAWRLVGEGEDAEYVEAGRAAGQEEMRLGEPFAVSVVPHALVER